MGRPFPLEEADEHFRRLKAWGLTFLRFLVTWEAVAHEGPVNTTRPISITCGRSSKRRASTAWRSSSIRMRTSGVASPAATARPAGRWKRSAST